VTHKYGRRAMTGVADVKIADALVQRLLLSGTARAWVRMTIPDGALVSTSDILLDYPQDRALSMVTTAISEDERGPKISYYSNSKILIPLETAGGVFWAEVGNVTFWELGHAIILGISGIIIRTDGTTVVDPAQAITTTSPPFLDAVEKMLNDVGWQNQGYCAPARAFLHEDGAGVDLELDLGEERGPDTVRIHYNVSLRPDLEAVFPPWPQADARYDPDSFVRALIHDWPADLSFREWWRGSGL
jgi:hypothetical protein